MCSLDQNQHLGQSQNNREWLDLLSELLSLIAESAGLFGLLSFFRVCKNWYSASSTALADVVEHEILNQGPWFLLHEDKNQCQLLTASGNKFTTSLPELLDGTTCLATYHGWLLLFKQGGSMFFFHVFSHQRIDLPEFPVSELTNHVAEVSSPPTSQDCAVCVISHISGETLDVKILYPNDRTWTGSEYPYPRDKIDTIKFAMYKDGKFSFCGDKDHMLNMFIENHSHRWECSELVPVTNVNNYNHEAKSCFITRLKSKFEFFPKDMKNKLGLTDQDSISTCGTMTPSVNGGNNFIYNESINVDNNDKSKNRCFLNMDPTKILNQKG
ncbi:F-box protein At1g49360-like [Argentina anserina]|uniref:F-box protein At1g49360-like n=1 Tax=Argentina anserina TaxID=57926 RepID=UPI0021762C2C|nr:F-box protein At1g49360-like [Potentilla anserina]